MHSIKFGRSAVSGAGVTSSADGDAQADSANRATRLKIPASPGDNNLPNLDLLRATAVLIVYFAHLLMTFGLDKRFTTVSIYDLSQAGVMIFFVHTAFVLMLSLERQKDQGVAWFRNFYVRRAFRIYPPSCLTIA